MTHISDNYPCTFPIEIDQERLRTYLRVGSLMVWVGALAFFGTFFGLMSAPAALEGRHLHTWWDMAGLVVQHTLSGTGIGLLAGLVGYLCLSHWQSSLAARHIAVSVDGPFLCIQRGAFFRSDRKIHFRCIHDYAVTDTWLSRHFGFQTLQMTTSGGGQHPFILIPGVKDGLKVRDMLAEIDAQRENG